MRQRTSAPQRMLQASIFLALCAPANIQDVASTEQKNLGEATVRKDGSSGENPAIKGEIVVVAKKSEARKRAVRDAVRQITPITSVGVIPRWSRDGPICLSVVGGAEPFDDLLFRTLSNEATQVNLVIKPGTCLKTITIIITPDADALVANIAKQVRLSQNGVEAEAFALFKSSTPPVRWLRAVEQRDADGLPAGELVVGSASFKSFKMRIPTRLLTAHRTNFTSITIIVDTKTVGKVRNGALAAYLTMVALSGVPQSTRSVPGIDTVLNLFDAPGEAPPGHALTQWDRAYLKALYTGPGNQPGDAFRRSMITSLTSKAKLGPAE